MHRFVLGSIALLLTLPSLLAQDKIARPRITGIHHIRIYVSDTAKSRAFYSSIVGFPAVDSHCADLLRFCIEVGPVQHVELEEAPSPAPTNWLAEISFATEDVPQLRAYLIAKGLNPGPISEDASGTRTRHFELHDPEGHLISFARDYGIRRFRGNAISNAVSSRIIHAGFVVKDQIAMDHFYKDILGFRLYWHGGFKDTVTDWYELQVPDGDEWIEYMLNIPPSADKKELGIQNHFSLGVRDIHTAEAKIKANGAVSYDGPEVGRDGKWSPRSLRSR